jgi:hypothetical protein
MLGSLCSIISDTQAPQRAKPRNTAVNVCLSDGWRDKELATHYSFTCLN